MRELASLNKVTTGRSRQTMSLKATETLPKRHDRKAAAKKIATSCKEKAALPAFVEWDLVTLRRRVDSENGRRPW
jgi:hypothetical protein